MDHVIEETQDGPVTLRRVETQPEKHVHVNMHPSPERANYRYRQEWLDGEGNVVDRPVWNIADLKSEGPAFRVVCDSLHTYCLRVWVCERVEAGKPDFEITITEYGYYINYLTYVWRRTSGTGE